MALPQDILESAGRVWEYHNLTKLTAQSAELIPSPVPPRVFDYLDKVPLSTKLMDLPTPTLTILTRGVDALPESMQSPPQDLRTLSSWLYMAAGYRPVPGAKPEPTRPADIYVAAFAIEGLAPGLYHFGPTEFALRHLRDGPETLALLRRGRPDLNFLATSPAVLLVSAVFSRAGAVAGRRGYRNALTDAGRMTADVIAAATGLGIRTMTRLKVTDATSRELIGLSEDLDYATAEAVQAMVIWTEPAHFPMRPGEPPTAPLPPVPRTDVVAGTQYPLVLAAHKEVTTRGVAVREIRTPLTELSPMPANMPTDDLDGLIREPPSRPLREALQDARPANRFARKLIGRDALHHISMAAFRAGSFYPLMPEFGQAAIVRPMWVTQEILGFDPGLCFYDPMTSGWAMLEEGDFRDKTGALTRNRYWLEDASAVCAVVGNLRKLLLEVGPDAYRLAHLEAGLASRRMHLAAQSLGFAATVFDDFYDDAWRNFLKLANTGWEVLSVVAIGGPSTVKSADAGPATPKKAEADRSSGIIGFRDD